MTTSSTVCVALGVVTYLVLQQRYSLSPFWKEIILLTQRRHSVPVLKRESTVLSEKRANGHKAYGTHTHTQLRGPFPLSANSRKPRAKGASLASTLSLFNGHIQPPSGLQRTTAHEKMYCVYFDVIGEKKPSSKSVCNKNAPLKFSWPEFCSHGCCKFPS